MPDTRAALDVLNTYGYPGLLVALFGAGLGIGLPIPVTLLLLTLGALSGSSGSLEFPLVAIVAVIALSAGHSVDFAAGRLGNSLIERLLQRVARRTGVDGLLERAMSLRGGRALLLFLTRFLLTPIACPISLLVGVTRLEVASYVGLEVAGTVVYVVGNLTLGRIFGSGLIEQGGAVPAFWIAAAAAIVVPILLVRYAPRLLARIGGSPSAALAAQDTAPQPLDDIAPTQTPQPR